MQSKCTGTNVAWTPADFRPSTKGKGNIYRVGNGSRCVIWNYDIFGFNGGRTREISDLIASKGISRVPINFISIIIR